MVWLAGPDNACTYVSQNWLTFTGRTLDEALGDGWVESMHPEDRAQFFATVWAAYEARREFHVDYRLRRHDGEYRWILDIGTPDWDDEGNFRGYIGSCMDISEARRLAGGVNGTDPPVVNLTRREQDVLGLLARGLSNREIAAELVISPATVRVHVDHILTKLDLHSRAQVVAWAMSHTLRDRTVAS